MPAVQYQTKNKSFDLRPMLLLNQETITRPPQKILIVDDDPEICFGLHIRLKANNYATCFAHDAPAAISTALCEMPDLVLLDIGLPGDDGYSVLQRMSAFRELDTIPVIVISGRDRFTHESLALGAGASRFLQKPLDDRCLLSDIRALLA
jgi:DNA-binding response OmpR family regulator